MSKYRIKTEYVSAIVDGDLGKELLSKTDCYKVQVKKWYGWTTVKSFYVEDDDEYPFLQAEELLEKLEE